MPSIKPRYSLLTVGVVAGVTPFVIHVSSSSTSYVNGALIAATYRDWVAVGGGAVAALCGIAQAILVARSELGRGKNVGLGLLLVALGGYQLASGFGVFQPKPDAPSSFGTDRGLSTDLAPTTAPPRSPTAPPPVCENAEACNKLGAKLRDAKDLAGAYRAFVAGCAADGRGNCYMAAIVLQDSDPGDPPKVRALLGQACDLGMAKACGVLGVHLFTGYGGAKDVAKALALVTNGCDGKDGQSCYNAGVFHRDGNGVAASDAKAYELFTRGCELEDAKGCNEAGVWLMTGRQHTKDPKAGVALFEKACGLDDALCFHLAMATDRGEGGLRKDPAKARELYTKACEADSMAACNDLADDLTKGIGGPKDLARAKQLFQRACDGGNELGCNNVKITK